MSKEAALKDMMGIQSKTSVSEMIYDKLAKLIMDGDLEEGYVFPNETVLCEQLQVGRASLREAYKALELSGYITRSRKGTVVNSKTVILSSTSLKNIYDDASIRDFNEYREIMERESAYLAAQFAGRKDVEKLDQNMKEVIAAKAAGDFDKLQLLDKAFHTAVIQMSHNKLIISNLTVMIESWEETIRRNFLAAIKEKPSVLDDMILQHQQIIECIRNRDAEGAKNAMNEHLLHVTIQ